MSGDGILCGFAAFKDLPGKRALIGYVKEAIRLNEQGIKAPAKPKPRKTTLSVPADLAAGLRKSALTWVAQGKQRNWKYM